MAYYDGNNGILDPRPKVKCCPKVSKNVLKCHNMFTCDLKVTKIFQKCQKV